MNQLNVQTATVAAMNPDRILVLLSLS